MLSQEKQVSAYPITVAEKEDPMTCPRCHGLLMAILPLVWSSREYQPSPEDRLDVEAWQCVNCGNYIDAVILANRTARLRLAAMSSEPVAA